MEGHLLVPGADQVVHNVAEVCVCGGEGLVVQTPLKYICGTRIATCNHAYMYMYITRLNRWEH